MLTGNKKNTVILALVVLVAVFSATISILLYFGQQQVYYINTKDLYDKFDMKVELEKQFMLQQSGKQQYMDSLRIAINKAAEQKTFGKEELKAKKEQFMLLQENILKEQELLANNLKQKILKQLNVYILEYAEQESLDLVFGANGNGEILFGKPKFDKTENVIAYANSRYHGKE